MRRAVLPGIHGHDIVGAREDAVKTIPATVVGPPGAHTPRRTDLRPSAGEAPPATTRRESLPAVHRGRPARSRSRSPLAAERHGVVELLGTAKSEGSTLRRGPRLRVYDGSKPLVPGGGPVRARGKPCELVATVVVGFRGLRRTSSLHRAHTRAADRSAVQSRCGRESHRRLAGARPATRPGFPATALAFASRVTQSSSPAGTSTAAAGTSSPRAADVNVRTLNIPRFDSLASGPWSSIEPLSSNETS